MFARADSLVKANERLMAERDSTTVALFDSQRKIDSLSLDNIELSKRIGKAMLVTARNLTANAIIIRRSGKIVDTKRSSRADDIHTCFTLNAHSVANADEQILYMKYVNPLYYNLDKQ